MMTRTIFQGAAALAAVAAFTTAAHAAVINEALVSANLAGESQPNYIEVVGAASESLNGKSIVFVSQNSTDGVGVILDTIDLNGLTLGASTQACLAGNATFESEWGFVADLNWDVVIPLDLGRSFAVLLMDTSNIPGAGAGPFVGGETIDDGLDFNGDQRDGSPLSWTGVPLIADDFGFAWAGFTRTVKGVDTDSAGDLTMFPFVGGVPAASDYPNATPENHLVPVELSVFTTE